MKRECTQNERANANEEFQRDDELKTLDNVVPQEASVDDVNTKAKKVVEIRSCVHVN